MELFHYAHSSSSHRSSPSPTPMAPALVFSGMSLWETSRNAGTSWKTKGAPRQSLCSSAQQVTLLPCLGHAAASTGRLCDPNILAHPFLAGVPTRHCCPTLGIVNQPSIKSHLCAALAHLCQAHLRSENTFECQGCSQGGKGLGTRREWMDRLRLCHTRTWTRLGWTEPGWTSHLRLLSPGLRNLGKPSP